MMTIKESSCKTSRRFGDMPCSPSLTARAILSGREAKHAAEAGSCQVSTACSSKQSCGLFCCVCSRGDSSVPGRCGSDPWAVSWAGALPRKQMAEGGQSQHGLALWSFFFFGGGGVEGNLDCHRGGCITCNLSIDRITLGWKVNIFCIDKMYH